MNRKEMVEKLKELPELYDQARALFTYSREDQLSLGLINEKEWDAIRKTRQVELEMSVAKRAAEDAIPWPEIEEKERFPKEYLDAVNRHKQLKLYIDEEKRVRDAIHILQTTGTIADELGLRSLATQVWEMYKTFEDPLYQEYRELEMSIDRKERVNTKVSRIRIELGDATREKRIAAGLVAEQHIRGQNLAIFDKARIVEREINRRRIRMLVPIRMKIEGILLGVKIK